MKFRCFLAVHRWGRPYFIEHGLHTNVRDYRQKCQICGKVIAWTQPKGSDYRYYPVYWVKREYWKTGLFIVAVILTLIALLILAQKI